MKLCVHPRKMLITLLPLVHDLRVDGHTRGSSIICVRYIWLKYNPYSDRLIVDIERAGYIDDRQTKVSAN